MSDPIDIGLHAGGAAATTAIGYAFAKWQEWRKEDKEEARQEKLSDDRKDRDQEQEGRERAQDAEIAALDTRQSVTEALMKGQDKMLTEVLDQVKAMRLELKADLDSLRRERQ